MNKTKAPLFAPLLFILLLLIASCRPHEKVRIKIGRLEKSLFTIPVDSLAAHIPQLQRQYGELFDIYSLKVITVGNPGDSQYPEILSRFVTDPDMKNVYQKVLEVYPDLKNIETSLSRAFSGYREEFPERAVPSVYTLISGFNQSMITADTVLAIALDKYLGRDEEMYAMLNLAGYQRHVMDGKYMVPDCMRAWMYTEFPYRDSVDNVLTNILYEGKVIYAVHRLLPDTPDSLIFGFTPNQTNWCRNNTAQMWKFLVEKKLLFNTDYLTINKLIGPAPFCSLFTRESPGRAATWLGYRIIRSYMQHNKVTLEELLSDNDYQSILAKAKFKP